MLSVALDIAQTGLAAGGDQASVLSRNVANAGKSLASRKLANLVTLSGGVKVASVTRVSNDALARSLQVAISTGAGAKAITAGLDKLAETVNDPELGVSPTAMLQSLKGSLNVLAASPDNVPLFSAAVDTATRLATTLNNSTKLVQNVRQTADADMVESVAEIAKLLKQFEELNTTIIIGTREGADVTDQLDARDDVLRSISEQIGINTLARDDNDVAIFTDSGSTLFDRTPRQISMQPSYALAAGVSGNAVYLDGIAITGSGVLMGVQTGKLAGLATVRDELAVTYQRQLDETARGIIEAFAESDQSAVPALPDIPGLFTYSGATSIPATGSLIDGLAGTIKVNPNVDPAKGGDFKLLRDGSIGDPGNPAYTYNTGGGTGFSSRLYELINAIDSERSYDGLAGLSTAASLSDFSSASSGWLEGQRKSASNAADFRSTMAERAQDALSRATGVSLDDEMTALLDVERSYQMSSKMLSTIDNMFKALLNAV